MTINQKLEQLAIGINTLVRNWQEEVRQELKLPAHAASEIGISFDSSIKLDSIPGEPEDIVEKGCYVTNNSCISYVEVLRQEGRVLTVRTYRDNQSIEGVIDAELFRLLFRKMKDYDQLFR